MMKQAAFLQEREQILCYLRLSDTPIRRKMQIYDPDILVIMDDSLVTLPATYEGLKDGGIVIVNSKKTAEELLVPKTVGVVATVDATGISEELFGKNIPNTSMLGAFAKITGLVDKEGLFDEIAKTFGESNRKAAMRAYDEIKVIKE